MKFPTLLSKLQTTKITLLLSIFLISFLHLYLLLFSKKGHPEELSELIPNYVELSKAENDIVFIKSAFWVKDDEIRISMVKNVLAK